MMSWWESRPVFRARQAVKTRWAHMRMRHCCGPEKVGYGPAEAAVCCLVRNAEPCLDEFLDHYRRIGVRHFFFLDNGSDDATLAVLARAGRDVTVFECRLPFKYFECEMRRALMERCCPGRWCLNVDCDELIEYPYSDRLGLSGLLGYLNRHRYTAVVGHLVDMFGPGPLNEGGPQAWRQRASWYDLSAVREQPYMTHRYYCGKNIMPSETLPFFVGGIRERVFDGAAVWLTKHPLVKVGSVRLVTNPHFVDRARVADITMAIRHYTLVNGFIDKVRRVMATSAVADSYLWEYERYSSSLSQRVPEPLDPLTARPWAGWRPLREKKFLTVSPAFEAWVAVHGA